MSVTRSVTAVVSYVPARTPHEDEGDARRRVRTALAAATAYLLSSHRHGVVEERVLFDARTEGIDLIQARAAIAAHLGPRAAFHRLALSPHPALGLEAEDDLRCWARETLGATSSWLGRRLVWVGAVHRDSGIAHAHAVLAGATADGLPVRVTVPLLRRLRADGVDAAGKLETERARRRDRWDSWG